MLGELVQWDPVRGREIADLWRSKSADFEEVIGATREPTGLPKSLPAMQGLAVLQHGSPSNRLDPTTIVVKYFNPVAIDAGEMLAVPSGLYGGVPVTRSQPPS